MDFIERESEFVLRADIPGVHKVGALCWPLGRLAGCEVPTDVLVD